MARGLGAGGGHDLAAVAAADRLEHCDCVDGQDGRREAKQDYSLRGSQRKHFICRNVEP